MTSKLIGKILCKLGIHKFPEYDGEHNWYVCQRHCLTEKNLIMGDVRKIGDGKMTEDEEEFDLAEGLESLAIIDSFDKWYEIWYGEDKACGFWWWLPWNLLRLRRYVIHLKAFSAGWKALRDFQKKLVEDVK